MKPARSPVWPLFGMVFLVAMGSLGCETAAYLSQAGLGQIDILRRARSVESVVADSTTKTRTRELLRRIADIKAFGVENGLVATSNYEAYADLERTSAVWVVNACEPLRFVEKTWSFPIVGSVPYLGWFDRAKADRMGEKFRSEGWDADVRGAAAYSTLGWFSDPVLSTMLSEGPGALGDLADTILHESTHATVYVDGQSTFNESIATFVGSGLAVRFVDSRFGPTSPESVAYRKSELEQAERTGRLRQAYDALAEVYASSSTIDEKLAAKAKILRELGEKLHARRPLNNATLAQARTYGAGASDVQALFDACGQSYQNLLAAAKTARPEDFPMGQAVDLNEVSRRLMRACVGQAAQAP